MSNVTQSQQKNGTYGSRKRVHISRSVEDWLIPLGMMLSQSGRIHQSDNFEREIARFGESQPTRGLILHKYSSEALMEELGINLIVRSVVRGQDNFVLVDEYLSKHLLKVDNFGLARKRGEIVGLEAFHEIWAITPLSTVVQAAKFVNLEQL